MIPALDLYDYRQRVAGLYYRLRHSSLTPEQSLEEFRRERDELFASHPQSALSEEQKSQFRGLHYYPYDRDYRLILPVEPVPETQSYHLELRQDGLFSYRPVGVVRFRLLNTPCTLTVYWIEGYGGGLFLPFKDLSNSDETYGGGRYLIDTIKGVDPGSQSGGLVVDFNYAYHPSCAYNETWHCPLAPAENRLPVAVRAGERL